MRVRDPKVGCMVNVLLQKIDECKQKFTSIENRVKITQFHPTFKDFSKSIEEDF